MGLVTAQEGWAEQCAEYLLVRGGEGGGVGVRGFAWEGLGEREGGGGEGTGMAGGGGRMEKRVEWEKGEVYVVMYPEALKGHAKDFWQHTGWGISSRYAEALLARVDELRVRDDFPITKSLNGSCVHDGKPAVQERCNGDKGGPRAAARSAGIIVDTTTRAEAILRDRISQLASSDRQTVNPSDVSLYPTGMTAIASIAGVIKSLSHHQGGPPSPIQSQHNKHRPTIIIYGFLYLDTFKLLSKIYDFHLHLLGHSSAAELDRLATQLRTRTLPNVAALFCEFPGNPLLRTPDLSRIRALADEHGFMVVCDDTVGTFVNVDVLGEVDVLVTSLTKIFSGACDVMGGSLVVNAGSYWCGDVKRELLRDGGGGAGAGGSTNWYPRDAEVMERNSRDLVRRMGKINANARRVYEMMEGEKGKGDGGVVREVFYPLGSDSRQLYECRARRFPSPATASSSSEDHTSAAAAAAATNGMPSRHEHPSMECGYGYLLSLTFNHPSQAVAFYDALDVAKGPSLGTNFTLACAYTLFAHYGEREWAAGFGVEEFLVRVSVGMEEWDGEDGGLRRKFERALRAAEAVGGERLSV